MSLYLSPIEREILLGLRHGPLDHYALAADLIEAPFMVRGSLKRLRGRRLVVENFPILDGRRGWELTAYGHRVADDLATDQLTLEVGG